MASKVEAVIIVINEGEKSNKTMEEMKTIAESRMFQTCHVKPPIVANSGMSITSRLVGSMTVVLFVGLVN
jgi:hypothetical protein